MRVRQFVVLVAVMCCVIRFGVLGAEAKSAVRMRRIPKSKLGMLEKAIGAFKYNAKLNRWEADEATTLAGKDVSKKPVIFTPTFIGPGKIPAYYNAGNMMADPCDRTYFIITDQSYAIALSVDCSNEQALDKYIKTYRLPKGVHAIRAREEKGWEVID
jgi:hypothetical protein